MIKNEETRDADGADFPFCSHLCVKVLAGGVKKALELFFFFFSFFSFGICVDRERSVIGKNRKVLPVEQ